MVVSSTLVNFRPLQNKVQREVDHLANRPRRKLARSNSLPAVPGLTLSPSKIQNCNSPDWAVFAQRDRSLPSWDRSLAANPKNQRSGTGLSPRRTGLSLRRRVREPVSPARDRLPQAASTLLTGGTGLSFHGPIPESKNSQDCPNFQISNFSGRETFYNPPPSVEKLEIHPNTRTSQFAKVHPAANHDDYNFRLWNNHLCPWKKNDEEELRPLSLSLSPRQPLQMAKTQPSSPIAATVEFTRRALHHLHLLDKG
uniref:Uncharacterized protein n=1 Tax=Ananas comosus var. bracteatus TaxID=296719 RepID=A0A6V7PZU1_ANACO|nr:unnamed protein product [Ananas comosus var. bracteatus]